MSCDTATIVLAAITNRGLVITPSIFGLKITITIQIAK